MRVQQLNRSSRVWIVALAGLVWLVGASLVVGAQARQLSLVSTEWPPFTDEKGRPRFALDLVEAALDRFTFTASTMIVEASRFTPALINGQFDGSGAVWKDAERERVLLFSQPYLENRLVLVGRAGGDVSARTLAELKGRRVAIVEGYSYGDAVEKGGPAFVRSKSEEDSLKLLLSGGVDYTLMDELVVQYIINNHAEQARTRLQLGVTPLVTRPLYFAVRRTRPDAESIISRFNAQLKNMVADRTYHRLLHLNWIWADVDGDGSAEYVPRSDRPGPAEPQHAYTLFTTEKLDAPTSGGQRFYFGGQIYNSWTAVPEMYKVVNPDLPDPNHSAVNVFAFSW
jgi:polar amino acid transport system substrate-binding protein